MMRLNYSSEEALPILTNVEKRQQNVTITTNNANVLRYPVAVIFVLTSKFFEALAANGIRTVLALYLRDALYFSESLSTILLHVFNFFSQFCPIFGAILADSYIGNARAISHFFLLYACGWIGLIATSFPLNGISITFYVTFSLLLIAISNGSIRACVTSLGALQFIVPEQNTLLENYFSHYYFVYYFGIFLSKILPPEIRAEISCFGKDQCYPAVFGTLGAIFFAAWITFLMGKIFYRREYPAQQNILFRFSGCVWRAIVQSTQSNIPSKQYWLDHSVGKYGEEFVEEVKQFLKIAKLFLPLPVYWALLAQQDSSWTFQATQMDTMLFGFKIEPDQAKAMGPIFLFTLIPIWQYICNPLLNYCGIYLHPLHSAAIGGICAALSFVCSGLLQLSIESHLNSRINILWQIPQFILLMLGELFLAIPGLQFAFTQAPLSMKSVLTAWWFINNAMGNLLVVVIKQINPTTIQSSEYFMYAIMMFVSIIIFTIMSCNYLKEIRENRNINRII